MEMLGPSDASWVRLANWPVILEQDKHSRPARPYFAPLAASHVLVVVDLVRQTA
jgi:hypothetical protein